MLKRMKLTAKLYGSFTLVLALLISVGIVGYRAMTGVVEMAENKGDADTIAQLFLKIRVSQRDYQLRHDEESLKNTSEGFVRILEKLQKSSARFVHQADIDTFSQVATAMKSYHESFLAYVELYNQREVLMEKIQTTGNGILATVQRFSTDQEDKLVELQNEDASSNTINDQIEKIIDAGAIVRCFLDARKNEKEFIISNGKHGWMERVNTGVLDIKRVATNLKSRSGMQKNIDQLDSIMVVVDQYNQELDDYARLMIRQSEEQDTMRKLAEDLEKNVDAVSAGQKEKMLVQISSATMLLVTVSAAALIIGVFSSFTVTRGITGQVVKTMMLAEKMACGDFTARLEIDQRDEIGVMARSLNAMAEQLGTMIKEIVGGINSLAESSTDMAAVSKQLSASAQGTAEKSSTVATAAGEMSSNFQSVSAAMEQSSSNIQVVATATEEMTATVNEIGQNAAKARVISEKAVKQSEITSGKMSELSEAAKKVGMVTETITEISEQTNLLALNATIEAARAGGAGKGFAVVANEIKELAKQTAAATVDIKLQIDEMQNTTSSTVEGIVSIVDIINEINNMINGIATAVEEQSAATSEIASNIAQAAQGIGEVNENVAQSSMVVDSIARDIANINQESDQVGNGSKQVHVNARNLSSLAAKLEDLVKKFQV